MLEQIKLALKMLDPKNDEHWTGEGLPRLDVMKRLMDNDVTRAQITDAAKSFTRKTPTLEIITPDDIGDLKEILGDGNETPDADGDEGDDEEDKDTLIEKELASATMDLHKAQKRHRMAQTEMDVVIDKRAKASASVSDAHTIQAYQKSQHKERERRAARKIKLDAFLGK